MITFCTHTFYNLVILLVLEVIIIFCTAYIFRQLIIYPEVMITFCKDTFRHLVILIPEVMITLDIRTPFASWSY